MSRGLGDVYKRQQLLAAALDRPCIAVDVPVPLSSQTTVIVSVINVKYNDSGVGNLRWTHQRQPQQGL